MSRQRILLIRTFRPVGTGGPVPPVGLLYIASAIRQASDRYDLRILDVGNEELTVEEIRREIETYRPRFLGLSTMTCEEELMREIAREAKAVDPTITILVGGAHSNTAREHVLDCEDIDIVVIQEGEETVVELLDALEESRDLQTVAGIAYRGKGGELIATPPRPSIKDLDAVPFPAWDLVDIPSYSRHRNWNGTLMHDFYAPICTSRGCPYECTFCHNIFGRNVRKRSPGSVMAEIRELNIRLGCREFHMVDDIFNVDVARAEKVCELIIESGLDIALSFPNGLRADIMTDRLLGLLRKAGTYKINYGFETATPRLQKVIKKYVKIDKANGVFTKTSRLGIITGAYFMLGIPTETREEMETTIRFAENSELDFAAFFKSTAYPGTELYESVRGEMTPETQGRYTDMHFFSVGRSLATIPPPGTQPYDPGSAAPVLFQARADAAGLSEGAAQGTLPQRPAGGRGPQPHGLPHRGTPGRGSDPGRAPASAACFSRSDPQSVAAAGASGPSGRNACEAVPASPRTLRPGSRR